MCNTKTRTNVRAHPAETRGAHRAVATYRPTEAKIPEANCAYGYEHWVLHYNWRSKGNSHSLLLRWPRRTLTLVFLIRKQLSSFTWTN